MKCPNQSKNTRACTCTYPGCPRHGICCECIAYHQSARELPACLFTAEEEKTYDRSVRTFVRHRS